MKKTIVPCGFPKNIFLIKDYKVINNYINNICNLNFVYYYFLLHLF